MQGAVARHLHVDPKKIRVVANGVNIGRLQRLAALGTEQLPDPGSRCGAPLLVTVGRLAWNKGYDLMPGVLDLLRRADSPNPYWWHIGSGDLEDSIWKTLRERGLSNHVNIFRGRDDAFTQAAIATADVFCQPSRYEGSSLTTLEALSHGRPVVATAVGGIPDKVENGRTGLLADSTSTSLAAAIDRMLTDRQLAMRCGENGRDLVRSNFSIEVAARTYQKLYARGDRDA
jgi:glycosyltransferase involved in cell wall biosynthesis